MQTTDPEMVSRWAENRLVARGIRLVVAIAPLVISIAVAWMAGSVLPQASTFGLGVVRWIAIAVASTVVLVIVDKAARRLLPLATLFGLTLAFPDQAPSRYQLALRRGSTAQLRIRIAEARAGKLSDTPEEAAEQVLELAMALSLHDRLTRGHSERVRAYTEMIGEQMGLTPRELDRLRWAGLLHDIGKLMVSSDILNKPGKLTADEFAAIKQHPEFGRALVAPLAGWLGESARAVWEHHERWDGGGYPRGLATTDISLAGRIVSVADAYDVMTSARSYKKPVSPAEARAELARCSGSHFDPAVVRAFLNISLGRLRFALGPMGWLAQVPMLPSAVAATATQGVTATAATVFVGAAAATAGLGLAGEPVLPSSDPVAAESISVIGAAPAAEPLDRPVTVPAPSSIPNGEGAVTATAPPEPAASVTTSTLTTPPPSSAPVVETTAVPTATPPATRPATTLVRTTTTAATTVAPATISTSTTPPATTRPPTTPTTTTTTTTTSTTATTTTSTTATTTTATTTTTTTTLPSRPPWLPPPGVATALHLRHGDTVVLQDQTLRQLTIAAPTRNNLLFDPDGDGWPGLRLARGDGAAPHPERSATFGFGGPETARAAGSATVRLFIASDRVIPTEVLVRTRLLVCGPGSANAGCSVVADTVTPVVAGLVAVSATVELGTIDVQIPAGGTIRIEVSAPVESVDDVMLMADTTARPSALTLTFP